MISVLSGVPGFLPGLDDFRELARKVDTARHHGVPAGCILELDLQPMPQETAGFDPVAVVSGILGASRPLLLRETVAAIHRAAEDPRVAGLIARVQTRAAPPGPVQELRAAIAAFTDVKPSLAWAETYPGTLSYYLASAFGEVWMQPSGTVGLVGFATSALFLRDALDKARRRGAVHRPWRIQVRGKPLHPGRLHRRAPRGRHAAGRKPARPGVAGRGGLPRRRSRRRRRAGRPGAAAARRRGHRRAWSTGSVSATRPTRASPT